MKVVVVHSRYRSGTPSGENRVVDQEAAALVARGHDVTMFQRHSDDIAAWPRHRRLLLPATAIWNGQSRADLTALLDEIRPDVVHVHNTFPMLTPSVLYGCRDAGVPVVATVHNYRLVCAAGPLFRDGKPCHDCLDGRVLPSVRHGCYRGSRAATVPLALEKKLHGNAWRDLVSAFVFISAAQRDLMTGMGLSPERAFVKHNLVPAMAVQPAERRHQVAYLGRLDEVKGVPFLMRSWDTFRAGHPESPLRLVVAGGGPLADEVSAWGATRPSVAVPGVLTRQEAAQVLSESVAAVVPSRWEEPFGLVAIEAMAAGTAPVAPAAGSFPELVEDGVTGVLYDPHREDALAAVLADVDRHPDRYLTIGSRGRVTAATRFDPDSNLDQLLDIYRFAVRNPVSTDRPARSLDRPLST
jgi:glycosyltransferase involved in cell wall biosynthesis